MVKNGLYDSKDFLTPIELCSILRVGRNTVYKLLNENQIHHIRIGKKILIPIKCVEEYIANQVGENK